MVSILKSDSTWFPESSDGIKFTIRANKTFKVKTRDFENYFTGVNFDFKTDNKLCFDLVDKFKSKLSIQNNEMLKNNYLDKESKMLVLTNITDSDVIIKETEPLITYSLCKKNMIPDTDPAPSIPYTVENVEVVETVEPTPESTSAESEPVEKIKLTPVKFSSETVEPELVEPKSIENVEVVETAPVENVEVVEPTPADNVEVVEIVEPTPVENVEVVEPTPAEVVETEEVPKKRKYIKRTKQ